MATISLPSGRSIDVIATVNASLPQQVEILGPSFEHKWEGAGEGKRIGQAAIALPPGAGDVKVEVKVSYSTGDGSWSPSHEKVTEEREKGEIYVIAEDGRGALDGNDLIVRFRWVA
jgi:hypothetical protein